MFDQRGQSVAHQFNAGGLFVDDTPLGEDQLDEDGPAFDQAQLDRRNEATIAKLRAERDKRQGRAAELDEGAPF